MIVYYQKSTNRIVGVVNRAGKKHLKDQEALEADMKTMFADLKDDVAVSRFEEDVAVTCGGTWDPETNTQTAPPPEPEGDPNQDRLDAIKTKMDEGKATLAEVQEYLTTRGV